jgi:hypothetical protein
MWKRWIGIAALVLATPAQAQLELVTDGGFDDPTTAAWNLEVFDTSTIAWALPDAAGNLSSGSLLLQKKVGENPNSLRASQCIEVAPGVEYALSGTVFWPAASGAGLGTPYLSLAWQLGQHCTGAAGVPNGYEAVIGSPPRDVWTGIGPQAVTAPAGVHSVRLYAGVVAYVSLGSPDIFEARWDDVSVVPEPGPASATAAIAALVALAQRRRLARAGSARRQ